MSVGTTRVLTLPACEGLEAACHRLGAALEAPDARRGSALAGASYLRLEQPLPPTDAIGWLRARAPLPRFYWADRAGGFELAGAGIAEEADGTGFEVVSAMVERVATGAFDADARVFATARFDLERPPAADWRPFKRVYAQLPLLELRRSERGTVLAVNLRAGEARASGWFDAQRRVARRSLEQGILASPATAPRDLLELHCEAGPRSWRRHVARLLDAIATGPLRKVVLARRRAFCAPADLDALDLLDRVARVDPATYRFCVLPTPHSAFLGASPERLYHRRGRLVETEILAGTRRRGASAPEDEQLARELLADAKDGLEHEIVRRFVAERLAPLCEILSPARTPELRTLAVVHHLQTPIEGRLKREVADDRVLAALHPTPAVCGLPTPQAMAFIREAEDFDRGLYCGPVGCFGREETECAVAIRSALVTGREVQLFAGAGIVEGSDADAEWAETIDKMKAFDLALGADDVA